MYWPCSDFASWMYFQGFLTACRLKLYSDKRNDPATPQVLSDLSPYLHYGQIAPQRAALEAAKHRPK